MAAEAQPGFLDAAALARLVRETPDAELRAGLALNGDAILEDVFRRMREHFRPESARGLDAVIEWRIRDLGEPRCWQLHVRDGACEVRRASAGRPNVTLSIGAVDFLRLVAGDASPARLVLSRRLRVGGDRLLAARVQRMFDPPES